MRPAEVISVDIYGVGVMESLYYMGCETLEELKGNLEGYRNGEVNYNALFKD